jgi:hypothetical protein
MKSFKRLQGSGKPLKNIRNLAHPSGTGCPLSSYGARDASEILGSMTRFAQVHPDAFLRGLESRFRGEPMHQEETKVVTLDGA